MADSENSITKVGSADSQSQSQSRSVELHLDLQPYEVNVNMNIADKGAATPPVPYASPQSRAAELYKKKQFRNSSERRQVEGVESEGACAQQ